MRSRFLTLCFVCGLAALAIANVALAQALPSAVEPSGSSEQSPAQNPLVSDTPPPVAPLEKFGQYAILWRERLQAVAQNKENKAGEILGRIRQQATQDGVRNLDLIATALVREALKAEETAPELVASRFEGAKQMAPDLPSVHLAEGWVLLGRGPGSYGEALRAYMAAYRASTRDFWTLLYWVGDLMVIVLGTILSVLLAFALIMQICYLPKLHHHLMEVIGDKVPLLVLQMGLGLALLVPFFLKIGIAWAGIYWLALVWLYMTTRERVVAISVAVAVGIGAMALPYLAAAFKPADSPLLEGMAREYRGEAFPGFVGSSGVVGPEAWRVHYVRGLFYQRTGSAQEARRQYEQALALNPRAFPAWINLGSLQYREGRYAESLQTFLHTLQIKPRAFEAHFNLAQAYRENLQFNESTASLEEAKRINPRLTAKYTQRGLADPRYQVIQVEIEPMDLWREVLTMSPAKEADGSALTRTYLGTSPLAAGRSAPWSVGLVTVAVVFALGLISFVKVGERMPFACHLCGRMICRKCQLLFADKRVCTACWEKARRGQFFEKAVPKSGASEGAKSPLVLGIIPGAMDLYTGHTVAGLIAMSVFFAAIWGLVVGYALMGPPVAIPTAAVSFVPGLVPAACMLVGSYIWAVKQALLRRSRA